MIFPTVFADETLYSLVTRIAKVNSITSSEMQKLIGVGNAVRAADIEVSFEKLIGVTQGVYGTDTTFLNRFKCWSNRDTLVANLIGLSNYDRNIWKWCPICKSTEISKHGMAYWHLKHQERFTVACDSHKVPLLEINIPFRERQSVFISPEDAEKLNYSPSCINFLSTALDIAEIQNRLVEEKNNLESDILKSIFDHQSKSKRIAIDLYKLNEVLSGPSTKLNIEIQKGLIGSSSIIEYLPILIYVYFGSIKLFFNHYQWAKDFQTQKLTPPNPQQKLSHREILEDYLKTNPLVSRTGFWKTHPKSARWLTKYDMNWLDAYLPSELEKRTAIQLTLKI